MLARVPIAVSILALAVAVGGTEAGVGQTPATEFADWTSVTASSATGTLLGRTITLTGGTVSEVPGSVVDGGSTLFAGPEFTPPLTRSDAPEMRVSDPPSSFAFDLGGPVVDPVLHLASLGSTLTFPDGTQVVRRSGDAGFGVSGTVVSAPPTEDVEGTVQLIGTFSRIDFSARYTRAALDGVAFQVGGSLPSAPPGRPTPDPGTGQGPTTTQPAPVSGVRVVARPAAGEVRVRTADGSFVALDETTALPVGSVVDARKGRLALESSVGGRTQTATVAAGIFAIRQRRAGEPRLDLVTPRGRARACAPGRRRPRGAVRKLAVSVPKGVLRTAGGKGVVRGRNAAWTIADRCDGTLTSVRKGRVAVAGGGRTVTVRKGRSYLVRARLFGARRNR